MDDHGKPSIGFIGIGIMGAPMVRRLLSQGFAVSVWNREPERADEVVPSGAVWRNSPAEVRSACDVVLLCVLHAAAVREVCFGPDGLATAPNGADIVADFSTISPDDTRDIAARLRDQAGMRWIDAPISGGPGPAEDGALAAMLGGEDADITRLDPILAALTQNATLMGPTGAGQATKTLNQAIVGTNYVLMAEIFALARGAGIDPARVADAMAGGLADSVILQRTYRQMCSEDFDPPRAYARQLAKDMTALAAFVEDQGGEHPLIASAVERYVAYASDGNEMSDAAAISLWHSARQGR